MQVAVAIFTRMHDTVPSLQDHVEPLPYYHHSESAPLTGRGAMTPIEGSDVELGDIGVMPNEPDPLKLALAGARSLVAGGAGAGAGAGSPTSYAPGLSFTFAQGKVPTVRTSAAFSGLNGAAVAAVLAREGTSNGSCNGVGTGSIGV